MEKDEISMSKEEFEVVSKLMEKINTKVSVIKVGNDLEADKVRLERIKESNIDLKRKVAISIQEKATMQTKIEKLQALVDKDGNKTLKMMESMEREINKLKKQNMGFYDMDNKNKELKRKVGYCAVEVTELQRRIEKEKEEKDKEIDKLVKKNKELQKEIDIRVEEDDRFHNLDI